MSMVRGSAFVRWVGEWVVIGRVMVGGVRVMHGCLFLWTACTQADVSRLAVDYILLNSSSSVPFYLPKTESC
jgi:hypothetical protein